MNLDCPCRIQENWTGSRRSRVLSRSTHFAHFMNPDKDYRPHVAARIFGEPFQALLVTGACQTIHPKTENIICNIECLHLPRLTSDLILGMDFIQTQDLKVKICGTTIILRPQTSESNRAICPSAVCDLQSEQSSSD
ncbi:hypothetical protein WA026_018362 [Henosepilachna vigintioctopunctata]|uniref:Uncharacterized protein n=1 Tax=Henosepilachna vigintioctopunctata TaxID=420089 RepID=A0AAW1VI45_9CUCU